MGARLGGSGRGGLLPIAQARCITQFRHPARQTTPSPLLITERWTPPKLLPTCIPVTTSFRSQKQQYIPSKNLSAHPRRTRRMRWWSVGPSRSWGRTRSRRGAHSPPRPPPPPRQAHPCLRRQNGQMGRMRKRAAEREKRRGEGRTGQAHGVLHLEDLGLEVADVVGVRHTLFKKYQNVSPEKARGTTEAGCFHTNKCCVSASTPPAGECLTW